MKDKLNGRRIERKYRSQPNADALGNSHMTYETLQRIVSFGHHSQYLINA